MDLRIHDVVADLNSHDTTAPDPDEPVDYHGTLPGIVSEEKHQTFDTRAQTMAESCVTAEWTGPWPTLHIIAALAGLTLLRITVDILLTVGLALTQC